MSAFPQWKVGSRYECHQLLGKGSFGEVMGSKDLRTGAHVAIKKMARIFHEIYEKDSARAFREIHILRRLDHPCIIKLTDVFCSAYPSPSIFRRTEEEIVRLTPILAEVKDVGDLYLVFEFAETDLQKVLDKNTPLSLENIKHILHQILSGLNYAHSARVIHRDLKPANILINTSGFTSTGLYDAKIADFGLSRVGQNHLFSESVDESAENSISIQEASGSIDDDDDLDLLGGPELEQAATVLQRQLSLHVVSRHYRAPEVELRQSYGSAIDVWSVGCILAELFAVQRGHEPFLASKMLFPGVSSGNLTPQYKGTQVRACGNGQLSVIMQILGRANCENFEGFDSAAIELIRQTPVSRVVNQLDFASRFRSTPSEGIDLLKSLLSFNPTMRITVEDALKHPFLASQRRPEIEVRAKAPLDAFSVDEYEAPDHILTNVLRELGYYNN